MSIVPLVDDFQDAKGFPLEDQRDGQERRGLEVGRQINSPEMARVFLGILHYQGLAIGKSPTGHAALNGYRYFFKGPLLEPWRNHKIQTVGNRIKSQDGPGFALREIGSRDHELEQGLIQFSGGPELQ